MRIDLNLHIEFGRLRHRESEGAGMSIRSKQIAARFQQSKHQEAVKDELKLREGKAVDEGFLRMRTDLQRSLEDQCAELNQEPEIGNILSCSSSQDKSEVTRKDTGASLSVQFDSVLRKVILECKEPIKFRSSVEVKPTNSSYQYVNAEGKPMANNDVGATAERALCALLGV